MKNPNATAALITGGIVTGIQWLIFRYDHAQLSTYWSNMLTGGVMTLVLLIGKDGIKGALLRSLNYLKKIWSGFGSGGIPPLPVPGSPSPTSTADELAKTALAEAQGTA